MSVGSGRRACCLEKASSWRVRSRARCAAAPMRSDVSRALLVEIGFFLKGVEVAHDDHQDVVEVVRNAPP